MKRPLFIIIGAVIILILLGVWVYLLIFNEPSTTDTYTALNLGDTTDTSYTANQDSEPQPVVDVAGPDRLRQLTTQPVVGYQEVRKHVSAPTVYYVAAGTGHIFTINLETGEERRISATTIPSSHKAAITPDGAFALIQSGSGSGAEFFLGAISTSSESLETAPFNEPIIDFTTTAENTFLYAIKATAAVIAKEYNPESQTTRTLFTVPFREAAIRWGATADATHYVYPKATSQLEGYVYAVKEGTLHRLPIAGYGLSAIGNEAGVLYSLQEKGVYKTSLYNTEANSALQLSSLLLPEKCANIGLNKVSILCATDETSLTENATTLPDSWFKGGLSFTDSLLLVSTETGAIEHLLTTDQEVGRSLEIGEIQINQLYNRAYFLDVKTDNLWVLNHKLN